MENHKLQHAFITASLSARVILIGNGKKEAATLCDRSEIKTHIPTICSAMGIDIEKQDVELLLSEKGALNENILESFSTGNRSTLMVAMTAVTIIYHRSKKLPTLETVDWIRKHFKIIQKQPHQVNCKPHRLFLDWYELVNANVFVNVPIPEEV